MNKYQENQDGTTEITLCNGFKTIVDSEFVPLLKNYHWWSKSGRVQGYLLGTSGPTRKNVYMSRLIMLHKSDDSEEEPEAIDHINGDPFDNRISNLRPCTLQFNSSILAARKRKREFPRFIYKVKDRFDVQIRSKLLPKNIYKSFYDLEEAQEFVEEQMKQIKEDYERPRKLQEALKFLDKLLPTDNKDYQAYCCGM